jgi:tRNA G10  N-methylase Trm11
MAIVADSSIEELIEGAGFAVLQKHTDRVHRSLTRQIFICGK